MAKYRIYPTKSNTLIEDTEVNTGKNEVMELWYGEDGMTRHLTQYDFSGYTARYDQGLAPHISATTAIMTMYNLPEILEGTGYYDAVHATSVDIEVRVVQQPWSEGVGRDFVGSSVINGFSNWYSSTTSQSWAAEGGDYLFLVFSGHIDNAYEDFSGEVTDILELWAAFTGQNYGFVVKYSEAIEDLSGSTKSVMKFYTEDTKTYRVPFIEFTWDDRVTDQRDEVMPGTTKRLYLYLEKDGVFASAYDVSGVTISTGATGDISVTGTNINNPMPGIYYVDYPCETGVPTGTTFTDTWDLAYESGMDYGQVVNNGTVVPATSAWESNNSIDPSIRYDITAPTLCREYDKNFYIHLKVKATQLYTSTVIIMKDMEYRLDIVDGDNRIEINDWTGVSYSTDENFIVLDTEWLLTGKYSIKFRYNVGGSTILSPDEFTFKVV